MYINLPKQQKGVVLIVSLVILAILTMIGTSGLQSTITSEKLAFNTDDQNIALQAAETALRAGERDMLILNLPPVEDCDAASSLGALTSLNASCDINNDVYFVDQIPTSGTDRFTNPQSEFWNNPVYTRTYTDLYDMANNSNANVLFSINPPQYAIELLRRIPDCLEPQCLIAGEGTYFYRITALGYGTVNTSRVILQSVVSVRYN